MQLSLQNSTCVGNFHMVLNCITPALDGYLLQLDRNPYSWTMTSLNICICGMVLYNTQHPHSHASLFASIHPICFCLSWPWCSVWTCSFWGGCCEDQLNKLSICFQEGTLGDKMRLSNVVDLEFLPVVWVLLILFYISSVENQKGGCIKLNWTISLNTIFHEWHLVSF